MADETTRRTVVLGSPGENGDGREWPFVGQLRALTQADNEATVMDPRPPIVDVEDPPPAPEKLSRAALIWYACALGLAFLTAASLVWKLLG